MGGEGERGSRGNSSLDELRNVGLPPQEGGLPPSGI